LFVVFGREKPLRVLRSGENDLWGHDGEKIGDFMKKRKMRWVLTDQRLIHADLDAQLVVAEYAIDRLHAAAVDIQYGKRVSGTGYARIVTDDLSDEWGKIEFFSDGVSIGKTNRMQKPSQEVRKVEAILNSKAPRAKGQMPSNNTTSTLPQKTAEDPLKILNLRYAKGEITKEQFEEMKRMLT
jgi:hypothetical protein